MGILGTVVHYIIVVFILLFCQIPVEYPSGDFFILVVSDTHISRDESKIERLDKLIGMVNFGKLPGIELVFNTGDVASRVYGEYTYQNPDTSDNRLRRAVDKFSEFNVPFYFAMGNHDYKIGPNRDSDTYFPRDEIESMEEIWQKMTGFLPYYSIKHRNWKFIILNSMRGRYLHRNFDDQQLIWLRKELDEDMPTLLFFHHPVETDNFRLWCYPTDLIDEDKESAFFNLVNKKRHLIQGIFVGHGHRWVEDTLFETIKVFETNSFADEDELMYYVVGMNSISKQIEVAKNVVNDN
jgi:predicted MPP superfamily phosphohydrolase